MIASFEKSVKGNSILNPDLKGVITTEGGDIDGKK